MNPLDDNKTAVLPPVTPDGETWQRIHRRLRAAQMVLSAAEQCGMPPVNVAGIYGWAGANELRLRPEDHPDLTEWASWLDASVVSHFDKLAGCWEHSVIGERFGVRVEVVCFEDDVARRVREGRAA